MNYPLSAPSKHLLSLSKRKTKNHDNDNNTSKIKTKDTFENHECEYCKGEQYSKLRRQICGYMTERFQEPYQKFLKNNQKDYLKHFFDPINDTNLPYATNLNEIKEIFDNSIVIGITGCWSCIIKDEISNVSKLMHGSMKFDFDPKTSVVMRHNPSKCELLRLMVGYTSFHPKDVHIKCIRPSHLVPGSYLFNRNDLEYRRRIEQDEDYLKLVIELSQLVERKYKEYYETDMNKILEQKQLLKQQQQAKQLLYFDEHNINKKDNNKEEEEEEEEIVETEGNNNEEDNNNFLVSTLPMYELESPKQTKPIKHLTFFESIESNNISSTNSEIDSITLKMKSKFEI